MHTVFTFCVLAVFVIGVVEPNFFSHVKEAESKVAWFTHRLQTVSRAKRQGPSTDCQRAIERFESHAYSEECQYVFEDEHDFFDGLDDDYIKKYCGRYNCSKWLPPILKVLDEECDYDVCIGITFIHIYVHTYIHTYIHTAYTAYMCEWAACMHIHMYIHNYIIIYYFSQQMGALIGILSYSCDVDDETHDVCIKEWQRLGNASMDIDPHFHENFEV